MMIIGSGCATTIAEPLCLPARPVLPSVSNEEKFELHLVNAETLEKLAIRELRLKNHIETIEGITVEHNKQFKAECAN